MKSKGFLDADPNKTTIRCIIGMYLLAEDITVRIPTLVISEDARVEVRNPGDLGCRSVIVTSVKLRTQDRTI